jgi:hypothetical protein
MLLILLVACRCNPLDPPQEVTFPTPTLHQVGGRFRGQDDEALDPPAAFALQQRCPQISKARIVQTNAQIREVTVWGTNLDRVKRVGAALYDGSLANAQFLTNEDGSITFPIACTRCELYLGLSTGGRTAACIGPGYSLSVEEGRLHDK